MSGWILMDPYGSVWVRMVPGDLFQGFPGPNPLKNFEKYWFGGFGGGGFSPPDPHLYGLRPAYGRFALFTCDGSAFENLNQLQGCLWYAAG